MSQIPAQSLVPVVMPVQAWRYITEALRTRPMSEVEDIVAALRIQVRDRCAEQRIDPKDGSPLPPAPPSPADAAPQEASPPPPPSSSS